MDTPGLHDARMPVPQWLDFYRASMVEHKEVALAVLVLEARDGPSVQDNTNAKIVNTLFKELQTDNVVVIFNRAHKNYTK